MGHPTFFGDSPEGWQPEATGGWRMARKLLLKTLDETVSFRQVH
jgi:hypothetical protein